MIRNWFGKLLYRVNRKYKDRLFCTIFGSEKYSNHLSPENAMRKAVDECINNNILTDVLKEQRTSAMLEALTTYNKKAHEEGIREEGREEMRLFFADELLAKDKLLLEQENQLSKKNDQLSEKDNEIARLKAEIERLTHSK